MIKKIIIDSREPENIRKMNFAGAVKSVMLMEYGDFLVTCDDGQTLVIERKEPEDFIGSMESGRLLKQAFGLSKLRDAGLWPYVMITGEINPGPEGSCWVDGKLVHVRFEAVQGMLLNIQELGVFTVFAKSGRDTADAIMRLSNRKHESIMNVPGAKKKGTTTTSASDFLAGLPGVGTGHAETLLTHCGSAAKALEDLTTGAYIPKFGKKRRDAIRDILGLKPAEVLQITRGNYEYRISKSEREHYGDPAAGDHE